MDVCQPGTSVSRHHRSRESRWVLGLQHTPCSEPQMFLPSPSVWLMLHGLGMSDIVQGRGRYLEGVSFQDTWALFLLLLSCKVTLGTAL